MAKLVPGTSIVLHTVFYILVLRSGALYPVNITVSPSYNFSEDDPWVFQEDQDCRSHTSVQRPRMFPWEQLPAVPALQQPAIQPVDLAAVQDIHESTGRYLQQVRGQPQPPVTLASVTQLHLLQLLNPHLLLQLLVPVSLQWICHPYCQQTEHVLSVKSLFQNSTN